MKNTTIILAAVGAFLLLKRRAAAKTQQQQGAKVGELSELPILDGSNWTGDWWTRLTTAADLKDSTAPNLAGAVNADPGRVGQSQIGLVPAWDGSLR